MPPGSAPSSPPSRSFSAWSRCWSGASCSRGIRSGSRLLLAAAATIFTGVRIHAEEGLLRSTFPDYAAYSARTKRLVPFVF